MRDNIYQKLTLWISIPFSIGLGFVSVVVSSADSWGILFVAVVTSINFPLFFIGTLVHFIGYMKDNKKLAIVAIFIYIINLLLNMYLFYVESLVRIIVVPIIFLISFIIFLIVIGFKNINDDKVIEVVGAIFIKYNRVFIAKRPRKKKLFGKWEFPGGKIEVGETPKEALKREIFEELGIDIKISEEPFCICEYEYDFAMIKLITFKCEMLCEHVVLKAHDEAKWVEYKDLKSYDFLPADIPIIDKILYE